MSDQEQNGNGQENKDLTNADSEIKNNEQVQTEIVNLMNIYNVQRSAAAAVMPPVQRSAAAAVMLPINDVKNQEYSNQLIDNIVNQLLSIMPQELDLPRKYTLTEEEQFQKEIIESHYLFLTERKEPINNTITGKPIIVTRVLRKYISDYWKEKSNLPATIDDLVNYIIEKKRKKKQCHCLFDYEFDYWDNEECRNIYIGAIKHSIVQFADHSSCEVLRSFINYYTIEKKYPSIDEYNEYLDKQDEFDENPEDFHMKYKHMIPTANLSKLKSFILTDKHMTNVDDSKCGICMEELRKGQLVTQLPCKCSAFFHMNEHDCLEDATIISWLANNKKCPMCRTDVCIEDEADKENK
jgi:hypothetical protein